MPLREGEPQVRKHIWLYASDVAEIKEIFGNTVGESKAIRIMVRKALQQIKAKAQARAGATVRPKVDVGNEIDAMLEEPSNG